MCLARKDGESPHSSRLLFFNTLTLATPLAAAIGADAWVQTVADQGRNIFHGNSFADNGAFQMYGSSFQTVFAANVARRMGGMMAWGQSYGCLLYTSPSPRDGLLSRMPSSA